MSLQLIHICALKTTVIYTTTIYIYIYIYIYIIIDIYISFIRPHLDYGDAIFDQAYNKSFHESIECIQYSASLAITRAIRGTLKQKLYQELGLEISSAQALVLQTLHFLLDF